MAIVDKEIKKYEISDEHQCEFTPCFRFTWPGNDEKYACYLHATKLQKLAEVMGFYLQIIPLEPEDMENKQCNQYVKPK